MESAFQITPPPRCRGDAILTSECSIESGLRLVAHLVGDACNGIGRFPEQHRSVFQPLPGEIAHGRFADNPRETLRKRRAGKADLPREILGGPAPGHLTMKKAKCLPDDRVMHTR